MKNIVKLYGQIKEKMGVSGAKDCIKNRRIAKKPSVLKIGAKTTHNDYDNHWKKYIHRIKMIQIKSRA